MSAKPSYKPQGYSTASPYLIVDGGAKAIEFYCTVLGATEIMRMEGPGGKIGHAEIQFDDSRVMLADEAPDWGALPPKAFGGSPISMHLYVEDVDAVVGKAVAAGAKLDRPVETKFYGDRTGCIIDPFGHKWHISTHVEDVPPEEMEKRAKEAMGG